MTSETSKTEYAPAEREARGRLLQQVRLFKNESMLEHLAGSIPNALLVLNSRRQIVFANKRLLEIIGIDDVEQIIGKRTGEALGCKYAGSSIGGCGTTEFCRTCGAVNAMLEAQKGCQAIRECMIITKNDAALDFKVWATPIEKDGELFTVFSVMDISDEKRRQVLERVFFHDILNTAGGISNLSKLLAESGDMDNADEIKHMIQMASEQLVEEILSQRQLMAAERGDLITSYADVNSLSIVREVADAYRKDSLARKRRLIITETSDDVLIRTDPVLLRRVIGNMVKNALEATIFGETVQMGCTEEDGVVTFFVHNPSFIPRNNQLQLFKRSFTTKGEGRGIGTYSMKLLGEHYLGGQVGFVSTEEDGTRFYITIFQKDNEPDAANTAAPDK